VDGPHPLHLLPTPASVPFGSSLVNTMPTCIYHPAYRHLVQCLVSARKQRGYSQEIVAKRLKTNRQWISKVETCEIRLDVLALIRLCLVYDLPATRLIRRVEKELSSEGGFFLSIGAKPYGAAHIPNTALHLA